MSFSEKIFFKIFIFEDFLKKNKKKVQSLNKFLFCISFFSFNFNKNTFFLALIYKFFCFFFFNKTFKLFSSYKRHSKNAVWFNKSIISPEGRSFFFFLDFLCIKLIPITKQKGLFFKLFFYGKESNILFFKFKDVYDLDIKNLSTFFYNWHIFFQFFLGFYQKMTSLLFYLI